MAGSVDSTWNSDPAEVTGKARAPDQRSNVLLAPIEQPDRRIRQPLRDGLSRIAFVFGSVEARVSDILVEEALDGGRTFVSEADMIFQLAAEEQKIAVAAGKPAKQSHTLRAQRLQADGVGGTEQAPRRQRAVRSDQFAARHVQET